jgi:hypothetical protein
MSNGFNPGFNPFQAVSTVSSRFKPTQTDESRTKLGEAGVPRGGRLPVGSPVG